MRNLLRSRRATPSRSADHLGDLLLYCDWHVGAPTSAPRMRGGEEASRRAMGLTERRSARAVRRARCARFDHGLMDTRVNISRWPAPPSRVDWRPRSRLRLPLSRADGPRVPADVICWGEIAVALHPRIIKTSAADAGDRGTRGAQSLPSEGSEETAASELPIEPSPDTKAKPSIAKR